LVRWAVHWKIALASAIFLIPIEIFRAIQRSALAGAVFTVPEVVVWADLGDALARAESLVENSISYAGFRRAHANTLLDV